MFVLAAKWEKAILFLLIGILLIVASLFYTVYLHKKERIHVPVWGWALLTIVLSVGALLLMINLIPTSAGTVTQPTEMFPVNVVPK